MIQPVCHHDKKNTPSASGWIFCCREDFEKAVRANLIGYSDPKRIIDLEESITEARARIHQLESDVQDMKMSRRTAFIRCTCGRMKEMNIDCRGCGV